MAWEANDPALFYESQVVDITTAAMPTYHIEPYMSSGLPNIGPYADGLGSQAQWTRQDQPRALADRITAPPTRKRRPLAPFPAMGLDGTVGHRRKLCPARQLG